MSKEKTKRKIVSLHVAEVGCFNSNDYEITEIQKNGEMAYVTWYLLKHKDGSETEINGKYVIQVEYD